MQTSKKGAIFYIRYFVYNNNFQVKRTSNSSKKIKSVDSETFKEIEYVNPDGTIIPKPGIGGWNSYQWTCSECNMVFCEADDLREHMATVHNIISVRYLCLDCPKVIVFIGKYQKSEKYP